MEERGMANAADSPEVIQIAVEIEANDWLEESKTDFEADVEAIDSDEQELAAAAPAVVAKHDRVRVPRSSLLALATDFEKAGVAWEKNRRDRNLTPDGTRTENKKADAVLIETIDNYRNINDSEFDLFLRAYPEPGEPEPTDKQIERLRLELTALATASPRAITEALWAATKARDRVRIRYLLLAHERQLERASPHFRPYLPRFREVVRIARLVQNGGEQAYRARAARELVATMRQQFDAAVRIAWKDQELGFRAWIVASEFDRPPEDGGRKFREIVE
jgi:hypothetical protein